MIGQQNHGVSAARRRKPGRVCRLASDHFENFEWAKELYRWALFDRPPLEKWVDRRVALLGDAAHPMLPFMAQGAAMAVEDAWVLAQQIAQQNDIGKALKNYQALRYDRASAVQAQSRANAKTFHKRSRLSKISTYGPMWLAGKIAPNVIHARRQTLWL